MAMEKKTVQSAATGLDVPATAIKTENKKNNKKNKKSKIFLFTLILIVILIIAGFLINTYTSINLWGTLKNAETTENYNAVFLSNGQVYFGIITSNNNDDYTTLKDIYYLQVSGALQQATPSEANQQPQLTLVKLGNELHGPEDYMQINNDHIIFIEKLKEDGKVVEAIKQYKTGDESAPIK